ncbi:hypothetical protein B4102_3895 [Heyndrickxia sporothermodurans]|uniref:Uncharacterized protein n=1 Tax=Heyndrickxia sporothermodurans TaxID=46224 RepID=A0A150KKC0_9BACI|nr:hypothetical protein B4102_3895 [Heyndrickxia sporothermodurans]
MFFLYEKEIIKVMKVIIFFIKKTKVSLYTRTSKGNFFYK